MRKLHLLSFFFLVCAAATKAQINLEPKVGVAISSLYSHLQENAHVDAHFGLNVGYELTPKIGVKTGLEIINKGARNVSAKSGAIESIDVKQLRYLSVPAVAYYKFRLGNEVSLSVEGGFYYATGIHGAAFAKNGGGFIGYDPFEQATLSFPDQETASRQSVNGYSRDDWGWTTGLVLDANHILVTLSYQRGFDDINKHDSAGNAAVNKTVSITLGYRFHLGK